MKLLSNESNVATACMVQFTELSPHENKGVSNREKQGGSLKTLEICAAALPLLVFLSAILVEQTLGTLGMHSSA